MTIELKLNQFIGPDSTGALIAEASSLGFAPGEWPATIDVSGERYWKFCDRLDGSHELIAVVYRSGAKRITVFND